MMQKIQVLELYYWLSPSQNTCVTRERYIRSHSAPIL